MLFSTEKIDSQSYSVSILSDFYGAVDNSQRNPFLVLYDKMVGDKMVQTNGMYGQNWIRKKLYYKKTNETKRYKDKISNQTINPAPTDDMIFSSILLPL